ncbi:EamA domain-containing membrane protein RarD [Glaciihabitans tibetensis]|uniref:EamA domain-containing membrane protein RarD n=1 Tax=Glaciihabitans tibetensis TaxID=1266600 RepID=A0A2T0VDT7_9MICO|nr:DMT family transporter [Glaciihabitans tibetensis]PRY68333.1 EamA domain-containing membrane protein RarD [Glaciihabitans tibetensis]
MSTQIGIPNRLLLVGASAAFVLSWSSGFIIAKIGTDTAPALTVLAWRYFLVAGILLLAMLLLRLRSRTLAMPRWRDIRPHLTIGLFAQFGYILPIYLAVGAGVSSGTTALIDAIQPLVVATLVGPLLGLRVRALQWVGLALGAVGVALIVVTDASAAVSPSATYLLPLVSLASLVTATFLERRTSARLSVFATLATHAAVTLVAVTILATATGSLVPPATASFWFSTVLIAVVPTLIAYALYWYLLRRLGITALNALLYLVAPTTAVIGAIMFGEPFTPATFAGLALGAAAIALVIAPGRTAPPERTSAPASMAVASVDDGRGN